MSNMPSSILLGSYDDELDAIQTAVNERRKVIARANAISLRLGDQVRLTSNIRPKGFAGIPATIIKIDRTKATVRIDEDQLLRAQLASSRSYLRGAAKDELVVPLTLLVPR